MQWDTILYVGVLGSIPATRPHVLPKVNTMNQQDIQSAAVNSVLPLSERSCCLSVLLDNIKVLHVLVSSPTTTYFTAPFYFTAPILPLMHQSIVTPLHTLHSWHMQQFHLSSIETPQKAYTDDAEVPGRCKEIHMECGKKNVTPLKPMEKL